LRNGSAGTREKSKTKVCTLEKNADHKASVEIYLHEP